MGFVSRKRGQRVEYRLFRSKKASMIHEIYFVLFQFLMIIFVGVALIQFVTDVATDIGLEKKMLAVDIALMTTAVYHAPGTLKANYESIKLKTPLDATFRDSVVTIAERDKPKLTKYWYLSDAGMYTFIAKTPLHLLTEIQKRNFTFYRTGKKIVFNERQTNALHLTCPTVRTNDPAWETKQNVFLSRMFIDKTKLSDPQNPVNRIVTDLSNRRSKVIKKGNGGLAGEKGKRIEEKIPTHSQLVIVLGEIEEKRAPGLVVYFTVDKNRDKARKLSCLLINELLTSEANVLYSQIMPVIKEDINETTAHNVFKQIKDDQIIIFLNLAEFEKTQIEVTNTADAIYRAIGMYYGENSTSNFAKKTIKIA